MLELFILGTSGTYPLRKRPLASALIRVEGKGILIDCGEATQISMQRNTVGFSAVDYILITHMHADHVSGLLGMLLAIKTAQRTKPIVIVGPAMIQKYVESFLMVTSPFPFPIKYVLLNTSGSPDNGSIKEEKFIIRYSKVNHTKPCYAYSVELIRRPRFLFERAEQAGIPKNQWSVLSKGGNLEYNGKTYYASDFLDKPRKGLKISYVTDTRPLPSIRSFIANSDIAVIEGMYRGDDPDEKKRAIEKRHMTWNETASMVNDNGIKEVILTHFSPSLQLEPNDSAFVKSIIPNAILGNDTMYRNLVFEDSPIPTDIAMKNKGVHNQMSKNNFSNMEVSKKAQENPNFNERVTILKKYAKKMGMVTAIEKVKPLTLFKFEVHLMGGVTQIWSIYKSVASMKEPYKSAMPIDNYIVFVQ